MNSPGIVTFNIGGGKFWTTKETLLESPFSSNNMFTAMFDKAKQQLIPRALLDDKGRLLIDRDPRYFPQLLNYLRHGTISEIKSRKYDIVEGVLEEAKFYQIQGLISLCTKTLKTKPDLDRKDIILNNLRYHSQTFNFKGLSLCHIDFSNLPLHRAIFCQARLNDSIFTQCHLDRSNFEQATMKRTIFDRAACYETCFSKSTLVSTSFVQAQLVNSNFYSVKCNFTTFKEANLKNSLMQKAQAYGTNFQGANLTNLKAQYSDFQGANFCDSTFSGAHITHSDIRDAFINWESAFEQNFHAGQCIVWKKEFEKIPDSIRTMYHLRVADPHDPENMKETIKEIQSHQKDGLWITLFNTKSTLDPFYTTVLQRIIKANIKRKNIDYDFSKIGNISLDTHVSTIPTTDDTKSIVKQLACTTFKFDDQKTHFRPFPKFPCIFIYGKFIGNFSFLLYLLDHHSVLNTLFDCLENLEEK